MSKWWMSARLNRRNRYFVISVYDYGTSLASHVKTERFKNPDIIAKLNISVDASDAELISAAIKMGVASDLRTGGRGKGLVQMRELGKLFPSTEFSIISGTGCYSSFSTKGKIAREQLETLSESVTGTLITWKIEL